MSTAACRQAAWCVKAFSGSNRNSGGPESPLKTWAELRRRIGSGSLLKPGATITVPEGLLPGDAMLVDFGVDTDASTSPLTIIGPYTVMGAPSTVQTARPRSPSTRTYNGITAAAGFDWTPFIASDVLLTGIGGSINGARAWVASQDDGVASLSSFIDGAGYSERVIANGDTFGFARLARVDTADFRCPRGALVVKGFVFTGAVNVAELNREGVALRECSFETPFLQGPRVGSSVFANCRFANHNSAYNFIVCAVTLFGGLHLQTGNHALSGGAMIFKGSGNPAILAGMLHWGTSISVDHDAYVQLLDVMFKGGTLEYAGIRLHRHGRVMITKVSGVIDSPSPYGVMADNSSHLLFAGGTGATLELVGSHPGVNDIHVINGIDVSWAAARAGAWGIGGTSTFAGPQV